MADVKPFRAVRYARPTATVTAPPYDVVDAARLAELRASDPHNVVHLTLGDSEEESGALSHEWLEEGVLVRDSEPSFWQWEQDYEHPDGSTWTVRGLVASLAVEPYDTGVVFRHERTHAGPLDGRLRLLRAARAQLEPILLVHDGILPVDPPTGAPDIEGRGTRLWRDHADDVTAWFEGRALMIADGHHRYEAALAFASEPGEGPTRVLAVLVSGDDPGLGLLATHRLSPREIAPVDVAPGAVDEAYEALLELPYDTAAAIVCTAAGAWIVHGDPGQFDTELVERMAGPEPVTYTPDREAAVAHVATYGGTAFLLRPPRVEDVFARARAGRPLPQKSTYFLPKLVSGLLFHPI